MTNPNVEEKQIQLRADTYSALKDIVPIEAEPVFDTTNQKMRVGNGTSAFKNLDGQAKDSEVYAARYNSNGLPAGRNLATVFSSEIASGVTPGGRTFTANSAWKWASARRQDGNYEGINLWDYIPLSVSAGTVGTDNYTARNINAYIIDIDGDYNYGDDGHVVGHHIDFCAGTIGKNVKWQVTDNNNGTADENIVWLTTNLYAYLNKKNNYTTNAYNSAAHGGDYSAGGYIDLLPADLQAVMREFRMYLPKRYSASGLLNQANAGGWCDAGKLVAFSEPQMYGSAINSYSQNTADGGINFDNIGVWRQKQGFKIANPQKLFGRTTVWSLSAATGVSNRACILRNDGAATTHNCANTGISAPLAFRL